MLTQLAYTAFAAMAVAGWLLLITLLAGEVVIRFYQRRAQFKARLAALIDE